MTPEQTAAQVKMLVEAGVDFIKDDELQADGPHCPFDQRVPAVLRVTERIRARKPASGRCMRPTSPAKSTRCFAATIWSSPLGGTCVMVSVNSVGLPALTALRRHAQVAIHGHRNGWGMFSRSHATGMSFIAFQKFWRLAGIDHIHVNGLRNKFCEDDASVIASARECLTPMFPAPHKGCEIMPVFSSGQSARQAPDTYKALGSMDLIYACGGGILAHPAGPAAGVRSLRQSWEAAAAGIPLAEYAKSHKELRLRSGGVCRVSTEPTSHPLYTWYGDDFTGSTDVLEALALHGVKAVLFTRTPSSRDIAAFSDCRAIGIAGESRSRGPAWMSRNLPAIFRALRRLGAPVNHYKVCSTFDSSPRVGSIGRAMELGRAVFRSGTVPVVVGAPHLGRAVVFGTLFAEADGVWYRIDRHPTMQQHPVTPMKEADLRLHLARQTTLSMGLVDFTAFQSHSVRKHWQSQVDARAGAVVFDGFSDAMLEETARILWKRAADRTAFAVGSSGLTHGLLHHWRSAGLIDAAQALAPAPPVDRLLVLSGSCSPVTAHQIRRAQQMGFAAWRVEGAGPLECCGGKGSSSAPERPQRRALHRARPANTRTEARREIRRGAWRPVARTRSLKSACAGFSSPAAIRQRIP